MSQVIAHGSMVPKSGGTAALLEVLGGLLIQTFGIGHLYAGRVGRGLLIMFGYWIIQSINVLLMLVGVGFVTFALVWLVAIIASPLAAASSCSSR